MTIYQRYYAELTITSDTQNFNINVSGDTDYDIVIPAGDYFLDGYTGEGGHLMEVITTAIDAEVAGATCTIDHETGIVTFDWNGSTVAITWTDTQLGLNLGYDGNQAGATSHEADYQARYSWFPTMPITDIPGDLDEWWETRSTSRLARSVDGTTYSVEGNLLYEGNYFYENLPIEDAVFEDDAPWRAFEKFWLDSAHAGRKLRVFMHSGNNASGDYVTAKMLPAGSDTGEPITIGPIKDYRDRGISDFNGRWDIEFMLAKYVAA